MTKLYFVLRAIVMLTGTVIEPPTEDECVKLRTIAIHHPLYEKIPERLLACIRKDQQS